MVIEGQVTDGADIYVGPSIAGLKIQALGAGSLQATQFSVGPFSADLTRGQTQQLVILGAGISGSSQFKVTIPGTGVTVNGLGPANGGIIVTVTVDKDAEVGPRSVFITNSNRETAAISGGVYVR